MPSQELIEGPDDPQGDKPVAAGSVKAGFFTIHKPNQGKPTRLATGAAAALLLGLTMWFLFYDFSAAFPALKDSSGVNHMWWNIVVLAIGVVGGLFAWRLINKPTHAEFLIATDSEMKKVTWTTRKQLWGSTKVVILFMLFIAVTLFVIDLIFNYLFYLINVLKFRPMGL